MELRPGYKQSQIGPIPEEWGVETIIGCCEYADYRGKTPPKTKSGTFLVTARNVRNGFIDYKESEEFVPTALYDQIMRRGKPRIGDVLITTEAPLGNVAQVDREDVALAQRIIKYRPKTSALSSTYLKYYLLSERFQRILNDHSSGSTAKGIKGRVLHQLQVAIPPPSEQKAIAAALSDVDALLSALDRLIAKKRDLKEAAKQQLLTGQTRLPGFSGNWETKRLAEHSTLKARIGWQGLTTAEYLETGEYYLVTGTDFSGGRVDWAQCCFVAPERYAQDANIQLRPNDVLLTKDGTIGKVGYIDSLPGRATLNSGVFVIRPRNNAYIPRYFYYVLTSRIFEDFLARLQAGSTISHLYQKDFVDFLFTAPMELGEQSAIASVLADMDAELDAIQQRRDKTRLLKEGMMQELLTGRTRLV